MPTLARGTVQVADRDGHTNIYKGTTSTGSTALYWGSNSSTDYGLEPYAVVSGINIPKGRHIVSAKPYITSRMSNSSRPDTSFKLEKSWTSTRMSGDVKADTRIYFPALPYDTFTWTLDVPRPGPEIAKYIQELVLDPNWAETNATMLMRFLSPTWTGSQKIYQAYSYENTQSKAPYLDITYSAYNVLRRQLKDYSAGQTNNRSSMWQGYRFRTSRKITVSGIWGGATNANSWVALFADSSGNPGAVIDSAPISSVGYSSRRINPVVLEAGTWYWIGQGGEASHGSMARLTEPTNVAAFLAANPSFSDFGPSTGSYVTSGLYGQPSVWTNATVTTSSIHSALGLDYIEGDHALDDFSPPTVSASIVPG